MTSNKKLVNYRAVDHVNHYKYVVDHANIRGHLKILNFIFQNLRTANTFLDSK